MTESDIAVVVERIDNLQNNVKDGQVRAEKWREHFDTKLDARPCMTHGKFLASIGTQLKGLWFIVGAIITALIFEFIRK